MLRWCDVPIGTKVIQKGKSAKDILLQMNKIKSKEVAVGIPKGKDKLNQEGNSVAKIGLLHEFGSISKGIPSRSFLRLPFMKERRKIDGLLRSELIKILNGKQSVDRGLNRVGAFTAGISKKSFTNQGYGQWAALKQSTKDAKGSSKILIDKGTLRQSITWTVR